MIHALQGPLFDGCIKEFQNNNILTFHTLSKKKRKCNHNINLKNCKSLDTIFSNEKALPCNNLSEDARYGPDVNCRHFQNSAHKSIESEVAAFFWGSYHTFTICLQTLGQPKNVSASTNMAHCPLRLGGRFYFLLNIFYTQIRHANFYFQ